jgi:FkbM family methyltransferase
MFYSQEKQDEFLENAIFKGYQNGTFMDIGAHDGVSLNNTLYFEQTNRWTGINVEPIQKVYDQLVINRPDSININCAVCNTNGTAQFICNTGYTEMLSGLKDAYHPKHFERLARENREMGGTTEYMDVTTRTVESICDEHAIKHIHYLSIDVEGAEFDVIKSINFDKVFVDVIGFENNYGDMSESITKYLEGFGYVIVRVSADIFMIHKKSIFFG